MQEYKIVNNLPLGKVVKRVGKKRLYFIPKPLNDFHDTITQRTLNKITSLKEVLMNFIENDEVSSVLDSYNLKTFIDLHTKGFEEATNLFVEYFYNKKLFQNKLDSLETIFAQTKYADQKNLKRTSNIRVFYPKITSNNQIWSGPPVDFVAPLLDNLRLYIKNKNIDTSIKAFLTPYQLLAIHPYVDNNGRIGRSLYSILLLESFSIEGKCAERLFKLLLLLTFVVCKDKDYYKLMHRVTNINAETNEGQTCINYYIVKLIKLLMKALEPNIFNNLNVTKLRIRKRVHPLN